MEKIIENLLENLMIQRQYLLSSLDDVNHNRMDAITKQNMIENQITNLDHRIDKLMIDLENHKSE